MAPVPAIKPTTRNLLLWLFIAVPLGLYVTAGFSRPPESALLPADTLEMRRFEGAASSGDGASRLLAGAPVVLPAFVPLEVVLPQKVLAPPALIAAPLSRPVQPEPVRHRKSKRPLIKPVKRHYRQLIRQAAKRHGIDPAMIQAIIMAESSFDPNAVSSKGAQGLMQLMPQTAESLGVADAFDPVKNIDAGVRYFRQLLNHFKGDIELALAAYNAGIQNVKNHNGVPPFKTTQRYVRKVLTYYEHYKRMLTG